MQPRRNQTRLLSRMFSERKVSIQYVELREVYSLLLTYTISATVTHYTNIKVYDRWRGESTVTHNEDLC